MHFIFHQMQWVPVVLFENQNQIGNDRVIRTEAGDPILDENGDPLLTEQ